jgi:hypothetical protein
MKKIILIAFSLLSISFAASAQTGSATQTVQLSLTNALEISFTATGTTIGNTVAMNFSGVNSYAAGVESATQQIKVRSNKNFNVTVKSSAANFNVTTGGGTTVSSMPVASVLDVKVTANNTGGTIAGSFSGYADVTSSAQNLITNATNGGDQNFTVQYKATPGFTYPAGTYTTDVVYTATQQ